MRSKTLLSLILLGLTLALAPADPGWGLGTREKAGPETEGLPKGGRRGWEPVLEEGVRAGIPESRLESATARLAAAGISPEAGGGILRPSFEAAGAGLPGEWVLDKVEEGALKGASAEALERAARSRAEILGRARDLLTGAGFPDTPGRGVGLLVSTGMALESGVPDSTIASGLDNAEGKPRGQVKAVVEGGESLYLAGLDPETVVGLMADCLDRNLRRPEILRVVRFAREQHEAGVAGPALRSALWSEGAQTPGGVGPGPARRGPGGPGDSGGGRGGGPGGPRGGPGSTRPPRGGHR